MLQRLASGILRYRIGLLVCIGLLTVVMAYFGTKAEIQQEFVKVVPADDPDYQNYVAFKAQFGEDGNAVIIGLEGKDFFKRELLNDLYALSARLDSLEGVERVLNLTRCYSLVRNDARKRFDMRPVMTGPLATQADADSLRKTLLNLPFYQGLLFNAQQTATLVIINLSRETLQSKARHGLIAEIQTQVTALATKHQLQAHYSGVPYIRSYVARKLPAELALFMVLAIVVTAVALYAFYRSFYAVIFPMILLLVSSVCTFGLVGLLGYKLSLITALIPPIIVILAIPPSIYMLMEYHHEFVRYGNKLMAMRRMVNKLGMVTLMINANTAFGFLTLYFTNVIPLREFGMLAFLATMLTYVLTIIMIPGVFSLLPPPSEKRLRHLEAPLLNRFVERIIQLVLARRRWVYVLSISLTMLSLWGMTRLQAVSYMVDDLPTQDQINTDLRFMENNFKAVMPFEIVVEAPRRGGIRRLNTLQDMEQVQEVLSKYPEISRSISIVDAIKWGRQAFYDGDSSQYQLPNRDEFLFLSSYAQASSDAATERPILSNLVDSTYTRARITGFVKDIGSVRMPALLDSVRADLHRTFNAEEGNATETKFTITGTTQIFLKANDYLLNNLFWSLVATFVIIGVQMFFLFGTVRVMLISMLPNIIPLAVTAGIMGLLRIPLKPSTALIYGTAFGIAIDNSIHYLAAYRHLRRTGMGIHEAVLASMRSTGMSIIYTSVVLFVGFAVFTPSAFGSTRALGILTSVTLLIAMFTNLLLMPAMLMDYDQDITLKEHGLIDDEDNSVEEIPQNN